MMKVNDVFISQFINCLKENHVEWHAMTIYQDGKQVWNVANKPYQVDALHPLYSVTKSFTSLAFGFLQEDKHIDLDSTWISYFPEYQSIASETFSTVTLRQLLTMTLGHDSEAEVGNHDDWITILLRNHLHIHLGTHFLL